MKFGYNRSSGFIGIVLNCQSESSGSKNDLDLLYS